MSYEKISCLSAMNVQLEAYKVRIARRLAHERYPYVDSSHEMYFMCTRAPAITRIIGPGRRRELLREHVGYVILRDKDMASISLF